MALTEQQKDTLENIFNDERWRRRALGQTPLVEFALMTKSQQQVFLRGLVQNCRDERDARLAALPTIHSDDTTSTTAERDHYDDIDKELSTL